MAESPQEDSSRSNPDDRRATARVSFATVVHRVEHVDVGELNRQLSALILGLEKDGAHFGSAVAVQNGYHSPYDFLERDDAPIVSLKRLISQDVQVYLPSYWAHHSALPFAEFAARQPNISLRLWGWAMVLRAGAMVAPHTHPSCHMSGVYYVESPALDGGSPADGQLFLSDPRCRSTAAPLPGQSTAMNFPPVAGTSILFPSYVEHYVLPFRGAGERIAVSFNVNINGLSQ